MVKTVLQSVQQNSLGWLLFGLLCLLSACIAPKPQEDVSSIVNQFYTALSQGDYSRAMNYYSPDFFHNQTQEAWLDTLKSLGKIEVVEVIRRQADTRFSGKFYIIEFHTRHQGKPARETLTLVLPNQSDQIKIVGHKLHTS